MRFHLVAGVALLGASHAFAQVPASGGVPLVANPSQGQYAGPYAGGPAPNNNNNAWGIANTPSGGAAAGILSTEFAPNTVAVPAPGTIVIRLNGRIEADLSANFTSVDRGRNPDGTPNGYKINPVGISSYIRLYPGFDGMTTNGLRYGAAADLRENFYGSTTPSGSASSPSGNTSAQTVFVRRSFTYLAANRFGLVRLGGGDGVIGLFDNCVFTSQCWGAGISPFNGDAMQAEAPSGATSIPFVWLSATGAEYTNNKIVYLSPQYYGFDVGIQYAPNMGNSFSNASGSSPLQSATCVQAGPNCISASSGNDPTRWLNQVGVGVRYQRDFGPVDVKAFGFYETAGKENLTTAAYAQPSKGGNPATFRYDNLSFYEAGVAVTSMNFTLAATYIGGAINGQLAMRPTGGAPTNAVVAGLTYASGRIILAAEVGVVDTQGDARLTHISQRHEEEAAFGGSYKLAPGLQLVGEYTYTHRHQGGFDFNQNAPGTTRDATGQGVVVSTVLTW
jgi:hypothetical protein